jgi:hypothetical protein
MQNVSATDMLLGRITAGAGNVEEIPGTAAGRALLDDASASAQRTTLGFASGVDNSIGLTGTANVASLGLNAFRHARTGDVVMFSGSIAVDPTAATTTTTFEITIPIASNFSSAREAAGGGAAEQGGAINPAIVYGNAGTNKVVVEFVSINTSEHIVNFSGGYDVI